MEKFTCAQQVLIIKTFYRRGENYAATVRRLHVTLGRNEAPNVSTIKIVIKKFFETGSTVVFKILDVVVLAELSRALNWLRATNRGGHMHDIIFQGKIGRLMNMLMYLFEVFLNHSLPTSCAVVYFTQYISLRDKI
uniref:DUF4817 domain-containing protein n=1 Tax=Cuerna arida TaxID=1464854 RepID=A0A1B6FMB9_9HEMI